MYTLTVTLSLNSVFTEAKWLNIIARSWCPPLWQMHVKEKKKNVDAAQDPTDCTHSRLWTQACTLTRPSCMMMVHMDTLARSHTHHTIPQIHWWERAREAQHRHRYTPTWLAWVLSTSGPLVTDIHTTLSSWQLIITPQPAPLSLIWQD